MDIEVILEIIEQIAILLFVPPLFIGIINKMKAWAAGRKGAPLFQFYFDLWKLLKKGEVYSRTATWIFTAGPIISLASIFCAGFILPLALSSSPLGFKGDIILFAYLLAFGHFFILLSALDTGSSFEGMGASRGAAFSAFSEPAFFLSLAILCIHAKSVTFKDVFHALPWATWGFAHPVYLVAALALFAVLLAENSRIPVDDPNTHLELTMIHEVMVLDHGGPDLAFILYGSSLKFFLQAVLLVHLLLPLPSTNWYFGIFYLFIGVFGVGILVALVESAVARIRLSRVPQFLIGASILAVLGLILSFYKGAP